MKKMAVCLAVILCIAAGACSKSGPRRNALSRPLLLWEKNQLDLAREANIWNGFSYTGGRLLATQQNPTLYFHLSSLPGDNRLTIVYSKNSPGRVVMKVNEENLLPLDPSSTFRQVRRKTASLHQGINFVSFTGPVQGLVVRDLYFTKEKENIDTLAAGESLRFACLPGSLRLAFKGRSRFRVSTAFLSDRAEVKKTEEHSYSPGFPFYKKNLTFTSADPVLFEVTCIRGRVRLEIQDYQPVPAPARPEMPPAWKGKAVRDVFIFLWDGCQAAHLGSYGYSRDTAPSLREFSRDAVLFRSAYANASFTSASVASLFTGLYPLSHGRVAIDSRLDPNLETLGGFFKKRGYATALFTTNANVSFTSGLGKGIDHFQRLLDVYVKNESRKVVEAFSAWVGKSHSPRFSYVHFMEPHFPLIPPPPFLNMYKKTVLPKDKIVIRKLNEKEVFTREEVQDVIDDYDSDIRFVDSLFGAALEFLKKKDLYEESLIILLADHGEACYEHQAWGHDNNIFEETVRIPLLIKFPASFGARGEVKDNVQIIDLFPSLHQLLTGSPGAFDSPGLLGALDKKGNAGEQPVFIQGFPDQGLFGLRWGRWYYVLLLTRFQEQLFSVEADPIPSVAGANPRVVMFLRHRLLQWLQEMQRKYRETLKFDLRSLSPEEIANLKTLGYL